MQSQVETTWAQSSLALARLLMHEGGVGATKDWKTLYAAWQQHALNNDLEELRQEAHSHPGLRRYYPAPLLQEGVLRISFLHDVTIDSN